MSAGAKKKGFRPLFFPPFSRVSFDAPLPRPLLMTSIGGDCNGRDETKERKRLLGTRLLQRLSQQRRRDLGDLSLVRVTPSTFTLAHPSAWEGERAGRLLRPATLFHCLTD